jgi:hypothetical protein
MRNQQQSGGSSKDNADQITDKEQSGGSSKDNSDKMTNKEQAVKLAESMSECGKSSQL